jgi:hypothetical protein
MHGSLQSLSGDCSPKLVGGSYTPGSTLTDSNYLEVSIFTDGPGAYTIVSDTVNGYSFKGAGTVADSGMTTIRLKGSGKPTSAGTNIFTIRFDTSICAVSITVVPPVVTFGGCTSTINGTYTQGMPLAASHTVSIDHVYNTAGTFTVSTDTVNGYSFRKVVTVATPGNQTIQLAGSGQPSNSGTNHFNVRFGSGIPADTCGFNVPVVAAPPPPAPPAPDTYFPLTQTSYWTYNDREFGSGPNDTSKYTVTGTDVLGGRTYQHFRNPRHDFDDFFRRDSAAGAFYRYMHLEDFGFGQVTFSEEYHDVKVLKETVTTNEMWYSDTVTALIFTGGVLNPYPARFRFTVVNANASFQAAPGS